MRSLLQIVMSKELLMHLLSYIVYLLTFILRENHVVFGPHR